MISDKTPKALPRDVPDYHQRQAAHLRALAATATTPSIKSRLLTEAEEHERLAASGTSGEIAASERGEG